MLKIQKFIFIATWKTANIVLKVSKNIYHYLIIFVLQIFKRNTKKLSSCKVIEHSSRKHLLHNVQSYFNPYILNYTNPISDEYVPDIPDICNWLLFSADENFCYRLKHLYHKLKEYDISLYSVYLWS